MLLLEFIHIYFHGLSSDDHGYFLLLLEIIELLDELVLFGDCGVGIDLLVLVFVFVLGFEFADGFGLVIYGFGEVAEEFQFFLEVLVGEELVSSEGDIALE